MSWLGAAEAADIMRCSEQTLIRMAKEGQFPTAKWAGKKVRIHESDLRPTTVDAPTAPSVDTESIKRLLADIQRRVSELHQIIEPPKDVNHFPVLWGWPQGQP